MKNGWMFVIGGLFRRSRGFIAIALVSFCGVGLAAQFEYWAGPEPAIHNVRYKLGVNYIVYALTH